jgi:NAD(P)-dependent dehydrogenase (short-subunit alcohol dehydrogenase family)
LRARTPGSERRLNIADVVAFLASPDAGWVTGQIVEASGGINP